MPFFVRVMFWFPIVGLFLLAGYAVSWWLPAIVLPPLLGLYVVLVLRGHRATSDPSQRRGS